MAHEKAARLGAWFDSNRIELHPSVEITAEPDTGLGLSATAALSADTEVLRIPHAACISPTSALAALQGLSAEPLPQSLRRERLPIAYLFLTALGRLKDHADYVASIPRIFTTALHLRPAELELLRGTPLHAATEEQLTSTSEEYTALASWLSLQEDRLELYRWAASAHSSRAFPPSLLNLPSEEGPVLIPGLDLLNHARAHPVTWSTDGTHVHMSTHYPISQGSQVYNNYGPKSNQELLASYGFTLPGSQDDFLSLKLSGSDQTHHWRLDHPAAPESLIADIAAQLPPKKEDESDLEHRGSVLETLEVLLVQKRKALRASDALIEQALDGSVPLETDPKVEDRIKRNPESPVREPVLRIISEYRSGTSISPILLAHSTFTLTEPFPFFPLYRTICHF